MKLKVLDIPVEGLDLEAKASAEPWFKDLIRDAFQEDYRAGSPALLDLHISKTCDNVSMTGMAEIDLHPPCHRCLENFEKHLAVPLQVHLAPHHETDQEAGDDMNFAFYKGDEIDLGEIVREMLVLEIPIRYLCAESCKGLCARCGQNLNLKTCSCSSSGGDPRFAVLKDLLKSTD